MNRRTPPVAPDRKPLQPFLPVLALMAAMISFQFGATYAKGLFPIIGAEGTTALRLAIAAIILGAVMRPWRARPSRAVLPALLGYGIILAVMNVLFYEALRLIPLGVTVALEFSGPLLVAVLSSRRWADLLWVGLALIGILLLSPLAGARALDPLGVLFALGAGGCWALYILLAQKAGAELGTMTTAIGTLIAALLVLPIGVAHSGALLLQPAVLLGGLVVGLFSTALPFSLEMVALTRMPRRVYGTLTSIEPALGALMGFLILHERLAVTEWTGIVAVVVASSGAAMSLGRPVD